MRANNSMKVSAIRLIAVCSMFARQRLAKARRCSSPRCPVAVVISEKAADSRGHVSPQVRRGSGLLAHREP